MSLSASPSCIALLKKDSVQYLLKTLARGGVEGRLVGGCVRDALLGQAGVDIDIAVNTTPDVVQSLMKSAGLKVIPTGLKHGTVTVLVEKEPFEVTSLRRDIATDGRHATIVYTTDWCEDAARRDFTMNALYLSADGRIDDFFGGREDLVQGIVRFIGDPDQRICEDFLRILRYYRFVQRFGEGGKKTLDVASHSAVQRHQNSLPILSKERIQSELFKILSHPTPQSIVRLMNADGVFRVLFNRCAQDGKAFDRLITLQEDFSPEAELQVLERLFFLLPGDEAFYGETLRLSRRQLNLLSALFRVQSLPLTLRTLFGLRHWEGEDVARMKVDLTLTHIPQPEEKARAFYARLNQPQPAFPLKGADLLQSGIAPGRQVGLLLKRVEKFWLEREGTPDKAACLAFVRKLTTKEDSSVPLKGHSRIKTCSPKRRIKRCKNRQNNSHH